jgi:DNA-binding GntR family transcriptional regulator
VNNLLRVALPSLAVSGLNGRETEIFSAIHAAITEQRLLPGARLTEEELAEIYDASRMRIRRVLLALAHTGMIDLPPGRGAHVARPSATEARSVFSARRLIEGQLLEKPEATPGVALLDALASMRRTAQP